jgi:hypothetical protein
LIPNLLHVKEVVFFPNILPYFQRAKCRLHGIERDRRLDMKKVLVFPGGELGHHTVGSGAGCERKLKGRRIDGFSWRRRKGLIRVADGSDD